MLDRANSGPVPSGYVLRAILHGVAAGACRVAAREDATRRAHWAALAADQSAKARVRLHQAASAVGRSNRLAAPAASSSKVARL